MLVVRVLGGLGNQMFQYAAGRALALEVGQPLALDVSGFAGYGLHQGYELDSVFDCAAPLATRDDLRGMLGWQAGQFAKRLLARPGLAPLRRRNFIVEPHFHYWPGLRSVPADGYLSGYWQSEQYFKAHEQVIRRDFTFRGELSDRNRAVAEEIAQCNAISLHIRRGDYVHDPKTNTVHGLCSLDYYQAATRHMSGAVDRPAFFVFSDDIAWAKSNLKIGFPCHFIDHNQGPHSCNDMRLMSACRHHIIANSSFSWWGAWLNPRTDKIVVAPKAWFANGTDVSDLFPKEWVTI